MWIFFSQGHVVSTTGDALGEPAPMVSVYHGKNPKIHLNYF
jgi:hypothetical protein